MEAPAGVVVEKYGEGIDLSGKAGVAGSAASKNEPDLGAAGVDSAGAAGAFTESKKLPEFVGSAVSAGTGVIVGPGVDPAIGVDGVAASKNAMIFYAGVVVDVLLANGFVIPVAFADAGRRYEGTL